ncbi:MAG: hypothetical protein KatS3mg110_2827 [Pirellulaceae bacterium]|nr:MAG: hypothetical protein KatS3mg110_2827 [Pirellulaceae bacterium]
MRLGQIDDLDLNLFQFDLDLTFCVFFLNAEGHVYARYGSRDETSPDARQSLEGLRYTMLSVLATWENSAQRVAPRRFPEPLVIRAMRGSQGFGRCVHCHEARELIDAQRRQNGQWDERTVYRYPLPDNLGVRMEVDRGNVVESVEPGTPAARLGLLPGDRIEEVDGVPIHSLADFQFALDAAPDTGTIPVEWCRGQERRHGQLELARGWRRADITWRASLYKFVASPRLFGPDLDPEEKAALGLTPTRLAFRAMPTLSEQARSAGIQENDIILGFDDRDLHMNVREFWRYVRKNYYIGETVIVNLIRDGQTMRIPMTLR